MSDDARRWFQNWLACTLEKRVERDLRFQSEVARAALVRERDNLQATLDRTRCALRALMTALDELRIDKRYQAVWSVLGMKSGSSKEDGR